MAGLGNVAKTGRRRLADASCVPQLPLPGRRWPPFRAGWNRRMLDAARSARPPPAKPPLPQRQKQEQPAWAKRLHRRQQITHATTTAAHTLRGGDGGGSGQGPSLRDSDS